MYIVLHLIKHIPTTRLGPHEQNSCRFASVASLKSVSCFAVNLPGAEGAGAEGTKVHEKEEEGGRKGQVREAGQWAGEKSQVPDC